MSAVLTFDVAAFRTAFPAFANSTTYPDNTLQMYWDMGTNYVSNLNRGSLVDAGRHLALNLMTAHLAKIQDIIASGNIPGQVNSSTIDKISVTLTMPPNKTQWQWWLNTTPYGQQLLSLLYVRSIGGFYIGGRAERDGFRKAFGVF